MSWDSPSAEVYLASWTRAGQSITDLPTMKFTLAVLVLAVVFYENALSSPVVEYSPVSGQFVRHRRQSWNFPEEVVTVSPHISITFHFIEPFINKSDFRP